MTTLSANVEAAVPTEAYVPFDCFITTDFGNRGHVAHVSVAVSMACLCGTERHRFSSLIFMHPASFRVLKAMKMHVAAMCVRHRTVWYAGTFRGNILTAPYILTS